MILIFDTETNGLPKNWNAPINDLDNWPRLVQLAYLLMNDNGVVLKESNFFVKPEGFSISQETSRIHGITTDFVTQSGKSLKRVLLNFKEIVLRANTLVGHNIDFDEKVLIAESLRKEIPLGLASKKKVCTMKESTDYCKIPGRYGYKWPNLQELHEKLFNKEIIHTHNALDDVRITAKCFIELKKQGYI